MSEIIPIPGRGWVTRKAGKLLRRMYPTTRLSLRALPLSYIDPEWFCKNHQYDVEYMLALLQVGAWIQNDWKPIVRYTLAKRLRIRAPSLFIEPFLSLRSQILQYQLEGGTFKTRDAIRRLGVSVWNHPLATPQQQAIAKLLTSITDDRQEDALIQPFHWIRAAVGLAEVNPVYGNAAIRSEMVKQKITLTAFLRARVDVPGTDPEIL